jgi:hypothetical protein
MVLSDNANRSGTFGIFGEFWATDVKNDILCQFSYGISDYDLKPAVTANGGSVTDTSNLLTVSAGTESNGSAYVQSKDALRYRPGHTAFTQFTTIFSNHTNDNSEAWIGISDGDDGIELGFYNGQMAVRYIKDGTPVMVAQDNFNGYYYGHNNLHQLDMSKIQVCRIMFAYLGGGPISIEILEKDSYIYRPLHTFFLHGKLTETHIDLPYLPIQASVLNSGNTSDITIQSGSWQGGVFGLCQSCGSRPFHVRTTGLNIGTTLTNLLTLRSKSTFNGRLNKIRSILQRLQYLPYAGTGLVTLVLTRPSTLNGVAPDTYLDSITMTDVDMTNSTLEYTTNAVAVVEGSTAITLATYTQDGQGNQPNTFSPSDLDGRAFDLYLDPGKVYTVAAMCDSILSPPDILVSVNWAELF